MSRKTEPRCWPRGWEPVNLHSEVPRGFLAVAIVVTLVCVLL